MVPLCVSLLRNDSQNRFKLLLNVSSMPSHNIVFSCMCAASQTFKIQKLKLNIMLWFLLYSQWRPSGFSRSLVNKLAIKPNLRLNMIPGIICSLRTQNLWYKWTNHHTKYTLLTLKNCKWKELTCKLLNYYW